MIAATAPARDYAAAYLAAGLSIAPIRDDGSKAATTAWRPYQKKLATSSELQRWFLADNVGIAIIHGKISGGSEVIDIDNGDLLEPYCEEVERLEPGLVDRLTIIRTPRPGFHLAYRCDEIGGNAKLAQSGGKCIIETRGEGGYSLAPGCPAGCHPTGRQYNHYSGPPLEELPTITPGERRALFQAASTFDDAQPEEPRSEPARNYGRGLSPGDDYNQRVNWPEILEPAGWVQNHHNGDKTHWRRPGKQSGWSATTGCTSKTGNDLFCCFSSNAHPFEGAANGRLCSSYTKFAAYALLNHAGDFRAAAHELGRQGYGDAKPADGSTDPPTDDPDYGKVRPCEKFSLAELAEQYPRLNAPVVDGLFREGEVVNIIAAPKIGKSWFGYGLAISIATGQTWLDRFETSKGKVLLVDNELHRSTIAKRIPKVGDAMGQFRADYHSDFDVWPLRGNLRSLVELGRDFDGIEHGQYKLIVLDAKYRFAVAGVSENDNSAETLVYNMMDQYAEKTGAAFVLIHHASKGGQSDKRVTDVGAGAGAQSRAADCHLVLREHEEPGVIVLDAAVRSFKPVEPLALRWEFPLWVTAVDIDPAKLKGNLTKNEQRQSANDLEGMKVIVKALLEGPATMRELRRRTGISKDRVERLVDKLCLDGQITRQEIEVRGNKCFQYQNA